MIHGDLIVFDGVRFSRGNNVTDHGHRRRKNSRKKKIKGFASPGKRIG